jgi:probable F420-dependent oxidoreductase
MAMPAQPTWRSSSKPTTRDRKVGTVQVGVHLPQSGRAASPVAIRRAAQLAEDCGFADVWVSDHVAVPAEQRYPTPYLFDPLLALTWAAAATERIGLGTSVMVVPMHRALALANSLASLDVLSGGRLTVGAGVGWSAREFAALDAEFADRGPRTDEAIDALRACWGPDPVDFRGEHVDIRAMKVQPKPAHAIPIWVGGKSEAGYRRAVERGDGFHGLWLNADEAAAVVRRLRRDRPEPSFTISVRLSWDPQDRSGDEIRRAHDELTTIGVQHVVAELTRGTPDDYLRSIELLAPLVLADAHDPDANGPQ